jgi:hypothetical protein
VNRQQVLLHDYLLCSPDPDPVPGLCWHYEPLA